MSDQPPSEGDRLVASAGISLVVTPCSCRLTADVRHRSDRPVGTVPTALTALFATFVPPINMVLSLVTVERWHLYFLGFGTVVPVMPLIYIKPKKKKKSECKFLV